MGWATLFEKANTILMALSAAGDRLARSSTRRFVLLTVAWCCLGLAGSGGSAEEKLHSSSSLEAAGACGGAGDARCELERPPPRAAKGSEAGCGGGAWTDCWSREGCGVADWDTGCEKEANWEKGGGVGVDT